MNTLTKGFAKRVLSMLLVTIMVFSLGLVGITSASAAETELAETGVNTVAGGHIYFDNSKTGWTDSSIQFVIGHSSYSRTYVMTKVTNTDLYYVNLSNSTYHDWGDATYYAVVGTSSKWGDGNWGSSNLTSANHYTAAYTTVYNMSADTDYHLVTTTGSANGTAISIAYQSGGYSSLNHTQYAYSYAASYGSTSYAASSTAGTVKVSGNKLSTATSLTSTSATGYSSANASIARTTTVTLTATPADGYEFVGWSTSASETYIVSESATYTYDSEINNQKYYALFKESTPPLAAPAISTSYGVDTGFSYENNVYYVAAGGPFSIDYAATHEETGVTYAYSFDAADFDTAELSTEGSWTYTGTASTTVGEEQAVTCYVWAIKDGVVSEYATSTIAFTIKEPVLSATAAVTGLATNYVDEAFTITVTDNSALIGTATYVLYDSEGNEVTATWNGNVATVAPSTAGTYTYYVVVTASDGQTAQTNEVTITANAKVFSVTLDAPDSFLEDRDFDVKATVMFAPEGEELTYTLTGSDGTTYTSADGTFTVVANTPGDVTYTVTVTASGGASVTDTVTVTITEDLGSYPIRILFKSSDTFGYIPTAYVNDTKVDLTKSTAIITTNDSETAEYYWYSYEIPTVDYGTEIKFAVNANRQYFYNASLTISAAEGDYVNDGGTYCYYLALENLNGGTNTLSNISGLTEDQRNWTESAVNMIYDADTDALVETAFNYSYANYGDANCDGKLNIRDATYIQKCLANMEEASELSAIVSDVNQDGNVTIKDATAIQKQLAGL